MRDATREIHERLHRHSGFAAIQDATIGLTDYRRLLARLHGFYVPFEAALDIAPDRSRRLADDLAWLNGGRAVFRPGVLTAVLPRLDTAERRLGALYVVEGAALGGRELARKLDRVLGTEAIEGRRFFTGRGDGTGDGWRNYLAQLTRAPDGPHARADIVDAALQTFIVFEKWLAGWSAVTDG